MKNANNKKKRVLAFIDGYNLYDGVQKELKSSIEYNCFEELSKVCWYDVRKIVRHCGGFGNADIDVRFYTSPPLHLNRQGGRVINKKGYILDHYNRYIRALRKEKVKIVTGEFRPRSKNIGVSAANMIIKLSGVHFTKPRREAIQTKLSDLEIDQTKEKKTDVNLAVDMIESIYINKTPYDAVVLVSGDSDLVPALKCVKRRTQKEILVLLPPDAKNEKDFQGMKQKTKANVKKIQIEDIKECRLTSTARTAYALRKYNNPHPRKYPNPPCGCKWGKCKKHKDLANLA